MMAASEIEDFNWNLRHFLDVLGSFQTKVNRANPTTLELLEKTLDKIGNLIENVEEVNENSEAIIFSIDESKFTVKWSIFCRICEVNFNASRVEYIRHAANPEHNQKLIECLEHNKIISDRNNNDNNKSKVKFNKAQSPLPKPFDEQSAAALNPVSSTPYVNSDTRDAAGDQKADAKPFIPNVFEDNIFEFIDSMGKQSTETSKSGSPISKNGFNTVPMESNNWRARSNETDRPPPREQWRRLDCEVLPNPNQTKHFAAPGTSMPILQIKPMQPIHDTKSIIQNGAILTGAGVKPCPTYDLNNMYLKYPHLNPNKVLNPLKPASMQQSNGRTSQNSASGSDRMAPELKNLFEKVNNDRAKSTQQQNKQLPNASNLKDMKKSELTNSLLSLPTSFEADLKLGPSSGSTVNRMPGRSATSISLVGVSKKDNNGRNNNRSQSKSPSENLQKKVSGGQSKAPISVNDKSKGAIPKQPSKTNTQITNCNDVMFETMPSANVERLEKFFGGDLTSLIYLMTIANARPEKIVANKKLIESVENVLKEQFKTVKCHLIGSHAYGIVKGGRAIIDIYLDLYNSFNTDKTGSLFVEGMNEVVKILRKRGNWAKLKCSEQTRYGTLSAEYTSDDLKLIECRFTFGTGVAVKNTEILNSLFAAQPVARQLVICIRLAIQEGSYGEWTNHFSGYVVALLTIFYLQINGKLPSVVSLQTDFKGPIVKCGENLVHFKNPTASICKDRVRDLLIGFFKYYGNFDYPRNIISPFEGQVISKNSLKEAPKSRTIHRFKSFVEADTRRWTNNLMCIQDIFENKRNVTQGIQTPQIRAFKEFCAKSLSIIESIGPNVKY